MAKSAKLPSPRCGRFVGRIRRVRHSRAVAGFTRDIPMIPLGLRAHNVDVTSAASRCPCVRNFFGRFSLYGQFMMDLRVHKGGRKHNESRRKNQGDNGSDDYGKPLYLLRNFF